MPSPNVLQPVDAKVCRAAKTILRTARHAALATLEPETGTPMASRVSLATASSGDPIFLVSQLSGHFRALEADRRASLLLGEPGKGDPLAHPRITIYGTASQVPEAERDRTRSRFLARHPKAELYADFADFAFWRLRIEGASFNGGFGKASTMTRDHLTSPTDPDLDEMEAGALAHMNEDHADALLLYATRLVGEVSGAWRATCVDLEGLDLSLADATARLWFEPPLRSAQDLRPRLVELAKQARAA